MKPSVRILVLVACSLLALPYFFPLWTYDLEAPQYPEGIVMTIWIFKLGGRVDLVNALNHYVGIKPIEAEAFPELKIMPWALGGIMALGVVAALLGRLRLLRAWLAAFALAAVAGFTDFYVWLYRYGHDLDPQAPFAIDPFMPAVLGTKEIMNFTTTAYPGPGGVGVILALALAVAAYVVQYGHQRRANYAKALVLAPLLSLVVFATIGCDVTPSPLAYGVDQCAYCGMIIADPRYGAELLTRTGKAYKFDSIECLAAFVSERRVAEGDVHSLWVTDFTAPQQLLTTKNAFFLRSPQLHSPMGLGLGAFATQEALNTAQNQYGGEVYTWEEVLAVVQHSGLTKRHGGHIHLPVAKATGYDRPSASKP
jgi:copper chaperone NosL